MTSQQIVVTQYGGPEVLQVIDMPLREPRQDEIRVKVIRAGVALADIMRRKGVYPDSPDPAFTPGYEAIGLVEAIGDAVAQLAIGDRVGVFFDGVGGYSSHIVVKADEAVRVPDSVDPSQAAAVMLNYVTAYQMLHRIASVSEGSRILIHGAAGGVGTALLELGRLAGLKMYGTASFPKHGIVEQYGAIPIDYRKADFVQVCKRLEPGGMDVVFDPIGGANWTRSLEALGPSGRFVGYGYTSVMESENSEQWKSNWKKMSAQAVSNKGNPISMYSITKLRSEKPNWFIADAAKLFALLKEGYLSPLVSYELPFREAAVAHRLLETSTAVGKIVLTMDERKRQA